jgi:hypothetical protein
MRSARKTVEGTLIFFYVVFGAYGPFNDLALFNFEVIRFKGIVFYYYFGVNRNVLLRLRPNIIATLKNSRHLNQINNFLKFTFLIFTVFLAAVNSGGGPLLLVIFIRQEAVGWFSFAVIFNLI